MYTKYKNFLASIVPAKWYSSTKDKEGNTIWFTAEQFYNTLNTDNPDEECMLRWDYTIQWKKPNGQALLQWHPELDHPAMSVLWTHESHLLTPIDTTLPSDPAQLGERIALITEAASLDTENSYEVLQRICMQEVLPRHWQKHGGAPLHWNTPACEQFAEQFSTAWIDTYSNAAVRRMKALAIPVQQFVTI